jgi:phenylalanyl-tRNA synthetase alpha chain
MNLESLLQSLSELETRAAGELQKIKNTEALEKFRVEWLGKKGLVTEVMKQMGALTPEDRPKVGAKANELRTQIQTSLEALARSLQESEWASRLEEERIDVTLAGRPVQCRNEHPVQTTIGELSQIFERCGFVTELGPEVEHEFFNFDALNIPASHPSRALQDTFYIKGHPDLVLRTHTSPVQIRAMLSKEPPIRMICPGRVFRADYDATHSPMFHQIEGLLVDTDVQMGDLKGTLSTMVKEFFRVELKVRLRPSFFPFTEPSAEIDIQCPFCQGKGCKTCKTSGWVEIGGCGMVDPEVFKAVGIDPEKYRGFAFGMGIERMTMLKYGVNDLRTFYESDFSFISQFSRWRP